MAFRPLIFFNLRGYASHRIRGIASGNQITVTERQSLSALAERQRR